MKKVRDTEMRREYTREVLGKGVRGKYYAAYKTGGNLVLLRPDVAEAFPTEKAVNDTLRSLIDVAQRSTRKAKDPARRRKPIGR